MGRYTSARSCYDPPPPHTHPHRAQLQIVVVLILVGILEAKAGSIIEHPPTRLYLRISPGQFLCLFFLAISVHGHWLYPNQRDRPKPAQNPSTRVVRVYASPHHFLDAKSGVLLISGTREVLERLMFALLHPFYLKGVCQEIFDPY